MTHDLDNFFAADPLADTTEQNPFRVPVKQQLGILAALLLLIFGGAVGTFVTSLEHTNGDTAAATDASAATAPLTIASTTPPVTFTDLNLTAAAAYVYDITTGQVLFEKNAHQVVPLASVTKLMTALVAAEILSGDAAVGINEASLHQYGNSGLLENEVFDRQTLTDLTLMSSSNDGAYAIAAAAGKYLDPDDPVTAFILAMNARAKELGMTDTVYKNTTGLDITDTESGADGSAADMAKLMSYIVLHYPELLHATTEPTVTIASEDGFSHNGQNTNYYTNEIPGLIGSKTGYTTLAGGNLVVAFNAGLNRPVVAVALGSTRQARFTDILALSAASRTALSTTQ